MIFRLQRKHYIESKYLKKEFCAKPIFDLQRQPPPSPEEVIYLTNFKMNLI